MRSQAPSTMYTPGTTASPPASETSVDAPDRAALARACFAREGVDPLEGAFPRKLAVHAGSSGQPVAQEQVEAHLARVLEIPRTGKTAAYLHVPFCESHCLYCAFFTKKHEARESRRYTDALLRELALWEHTPLLRSAPVHCVYFGGGTPTALEAADLRRIILAVRKTLPLANDCEITVEGRIHNFGPDKMEACLEAGVNRFSIGVQTFDTALRRDMGRMAAREEVLAVLGRLIAYDQAAVVIDLIYGFPRQDMDLWRRDLETAVALELDGIDLYQLNTFPGTPLHRAVEGGGLPPPADIATQGHMYAEGSRILTGARWHRLSASHWGRSPRERNIYNHMVKGPAHCLGFGPGAGGTLHGCAYFTRRDYGGWLDELDRGRKPVAALLLPPPQATLARSLAQAFDVGRINLTRLGHALSMPLAEAARPITDQWIRAGLLQADGEWLESTVAGHFWQVTMAQLLITFFNQILQEQCVP